MLGREPIAGRRSDAADDTSGRIGVRAMWASNRVGHRKLKGLW